MMILYLFGFDFR